MAIATLTRDLVAEEVYLKIGSIIDGQPLGARRQQRAIRQRDILLNYLSKILMHPWTIPDAASKLVLENADNEYGVGDIVVGSDTLNYRCKQSIATSVDATHEPITGTDWDDYFQLTTVTGSAWQTGVTYTAGIDSDIEELLRVTYYDTSEEQPVNIVGIEKFHEYYVKGANAVTENVYLSETKALTDRTIKLDKVPTTVTTEELRYVFERPLGLPVVSTSIIDIDSGWELYFITQLAATLAPYEKVDPQQFIAEAAILFEPLKSVMRPKYLKGFSGDK